MLECPLTTEYRVTRFRRRWIGTAAALTLGAAPLSAQGITLSGGIDWMGNGGGDRLGSWGSLDWHRPLGASRELELGIGVATLRRVSTESRDHQRTWAVGPRITIAWAEPGDGWRPVVGVGLGASRFETEITGPSREPWRIVQGIASSEIFIGVRGPTGGILRGVELRRVKYQGPPRTDGTAMLLGVVVGW